MTDDARPSEDRLPDDSGPLRDAHSLPVGDDSPSLDAAWKAAEDALPEGASILLGDGRDHPGYGYWATASWREDDHLVVVGGKRQDGRTTPAAALEYLTSALAARLSKEDTDDRP